MAVVYVITNKQNGKKYVGKTVQPLEVRWYGHVSSARRGDNGMLVCRAIKKHGVEAFDHVVLEECDEASLGDREKHWIAELKTHVSQGGYNLTLGGDGGLPGFEFSEASREKIRQRALGRKATPEAKVKMRLAKLGKKQRPEDVAKRAAANTGQKRTIDQRANISASLLGHEVKAATRAKISIAGKGRKTSVVAKEKLRIASTGRKQSASAKQQIALARSKPVVQLDVHGTLVGEFASIKEAAQLSGCASASISRSLRSNRCIAGYRWHYKNQERNGDV